MRPIFGHAKEGPIFAEGGWAHGVQALVGHIAQLLRDAFLDHLEVCVPLMCVGFEAGPLGALPLASSEHKSSFRCSSPGSVFKSLFVWDVCWANPMEAALEDFVLQALHVEKYLQYRIYTDVAEGGQRLHIVSQLDYASPSS